MSDRVTITLEDGVADVRLTRADKMNALDDAMFEGLIEAGEAVSKNPAVRAVVLSGEGRAFCAGLDMGNFANTAEGGQRRTLTERTHGIVNRAQKAAWVWHECPVPVVAAVHGVAFGGGFQVCLGADIRIVHPETKMSIMEIKWGLVPDMAGFALMPKIAREDVLRELTYTGRVFSGEEAHGYGFATRLASDPYAEAMALAREIAGNNPNAIQAGKRLFNALGKMSEAETLQAESHEQDKITSHPNQREAVVSQMEKRAANYEDGRW